MVCMTHVCPALDADRHAAFSIDQGEVEVTILTSENASGKAGGIEV